MSFGLGPLFLFSVQGQLRSNRPGSGDSFWFSKTESALAVPRPLVTGLQMPWKLIRYWICPVSQEGSGRVRGGRALCYHPLPPFSGDPQPSRRRKRRQALGGGSQEKSLAVSTAAEPADSIWRGGCSEFPELAAGCRGRLRRQARTRLARSAQPSALQLQPLCPAGFKKKSCCGSDALSWLRFVMVPETLRPLQLVLRDYHMTEAEGLSRLHSLVFCRRG